MRTTTLKRLRAGEKCRIDGEPYMKIREISYREGRYGTLARHPANVVCLADGHLQFFAGEERVERIDIPV